MNPVVLLYAAILLISGLTFAYAMWSYYECPSTRSHKPYIFPIFVSVGWFMTSVQGIVNHITGGHGAPDGVSFLLLTIVTLIALLIFIRYYRRCRQDHHIIEE